MSRDGLLQSFPKAGSRSPKGSLQECQADLHSVIWTYHSNMRQSLTVRANVLTLNPCYKCRHMCSKTSKMLLYTDAIGHHYHIRVSYMEVPFLMPDYDKAWQRNE